MYITIIIKHLLRNLLANQSQISCEASLGSGKESLYIGTGHMTKMAAMPIYGKNHQKSNRLRYQVSVYRTIGPLVLN